MSENVTGTVKWFSDQKGFGFIEHAGGKYILAYSLEDFLEQWREFIIGLLNQGK